MTASTIALVLLAVLAMVFTSSLLFWSVLDTICRDLHFCF